MNLEQKQAARARYLKWNEAHPGLAVQRAAEWAKANPERHKAISVASAKRRKAKIAAKSRAWYAKNKARSLARKRLWRQSNSAYVKAYNAAWKKLNPHKVTACTVRRQAHKLRATPKWADSIALEQYYELAKMRSKVTGYKWHVDHIVPLRSKIVCGLQVESNLRVIPAIENVAKGNLTWPEMP